VLLGASYLFQRLIHMREQAAPEVQRVSEETKSVTVYFGNKGADAFLTETREIPAGGGFEAQVKAAVGELLKGPQGGDRVGVMPAGTELRQAFWVEDSQTLYLDFNNALVANHPGGSAGEYFTIGAILKTVSANFPQVKRVQILIDGNKVETIAGHYAVDKPIDVQKWR
jgi:spore germination protein GerM